LLERVTTKKEEHILGAYYEFKCLGCKYTTEVSGGEDYGFRLQTLTMVCPDCMSLVDVITKPGFPDQEELVGKCTHCHSTKVKSWNPEEKPCPKCGKKMEKGPLTVYWD
jgi:Zn finger protein HypA/HybF involved in hydrogenase expression